MSQAIFPIRRPLNWGTIVFWSPVSIGAGVELVVLEIRNIKIKSNQSADREAWEDVIRIGDACFQKFVYLISCLVFLSYTKLRFYLNENETWEKYNHRLFGWEYRPKRKLSSNSQAISEVTAGSHRSRMPYHSSWAMLSFQPKLPVADGKGTPLDVWYSWCLSSGGPDLTRALPVFFHWWWGCHSPSWNFLSVKYIVITN